MTKDEFLKLSDGYRNSACTDIEIIQTVITELWNADDLTAFQKLSICVCQKLSNDFIMSVWDTLNGDQKECIIKYQKLSEKFVDKLNKTYNKNGNILKRLEQIRKKIVKVY